MNRRTFFSAAVANLLMASGISAQESAKHYRLGIISTGTNPRSANAVTLFADTFFVQQLQQIAQVALKQRVPSIYTIHEYVEVGGLMSYGADLVDNFRRAATYVDKILKGANPGDLPFEQPTRYSFAINLKTAKALGLTIPQSLLLRADEVIQ